MRPIRALLRSIRRCGHGRPGRPARSVNGANIAWVSGTTDAPVCIWTISQWQNIEYFQDNQYRDHFDLHYDGLPSTASHPYLTASAPVQQGVPVAVRIVICDETDPVLDSAVFIRARQATPCEWAPVSSGHASLKTRTETD
ncbi:MAG: choice-of-anchor L domain-containing protein [Verrucomicrobiales bacterium]|nr:choice-of-anchor L domain-containing protein [Verrucomicrobiales bacterium]